MADFQEDTQLIDIFTFNPDKQIIFEDVVAGSVPNTPIKFKRISMKCINKDGKTKSDLLFATKKVFSFGVSESKNDRDEVTGYSMSLCLWNKDGPSDFERKLTDIYDSIVQRCKTFLVDKTVTKQIGKIGLEERDLKKFGGLYWKKDDEGNIIEKYGPTLYPKLIVSKKHDRILTNFFDKSGNKIDPLTLNGKYCNAICVIKIESIFVGKDISLQVKLWEVQVEVIEFGLKKMLTESLLNSSQPDSTPLKEEEETKEEEENETSDEDDNKLSKSDDEEGEPKVKRTPKPRAKK